MKTQIQIECELEACREEAAQSSSLLNQYRYFIKALEWVLDVNQEEQED